MLKYGDDAVSLICIELATTIECARTRMVVLQMIARMLAAVMMLGVAIAQADSSAERLLKQDIDRQEQERRERRWDEPMTTMPQQQPAPSSPEKAEAKGPCFPISDIRVIKADILPAKPLQRLIASYTGRCLYITDLQSLQQAMNSLALSRGLITTRVVIPEQNLGNGMLLLEVWPGHMEESRLNSAHRMELDMALPLQNGDLLNLRALEQAIDNLNRLESMQATMQLEPGEKPGGSIADFTIIRQRPWHLAATWDSEAMEQHPSNTVRLSLTLDSPLNLADRLIVGLNANLQDVEVDNANGSSIDYELPIGWWRFSTGMDQYEYHNPITAGLTTFISSGKSQSTRIELSRLIWRDDKHRMIVALNGKQRTNNNFIDDVTIAVSSSRLKAAGLRIDISRVQAPWVIDGGFGVEQGDARSLASPSPVDEEFMRLMASTRLQYHWPHSSLAWTVNAQWSDSVLLPSEQFALAGSVRGFYPLSLNVATGLASRVEWARPVFFDWRGLTNVRPQIGIEFSHAPSVSGNESEERLTALTGGMIVPWKKLLAQLMVAAPLASTSTQSPPDDWQLDASVSLKW